MIDEFTIPLFVVNEKVDNEDASVTNKEEAELPSATIDPLHRQWWLLVLLYVNSGQRKVSIIQMEPLFEYRGSGSPRLSTID